MTKQEFFRLLNNLDTAGQPEIDQLEDMLRQHAYFQLAPILQAKIASRINSTAKNKHITKAAIYTADRANLKDIIEDRVILAQPAIEEHPAHDLMPVQKSSVTETDIQNIVKEIKKPSEPSRSDELYKEVMKNLATLKSLRKKYEFLEEKEKEKEEMQAREEIVEIEEKKQPATNNRKKTKANKEEKPKEKPTRKKEAIAKIEETDPVQEIDNIQKIDLEEQNLLIDSFIKNEVQFSRKKPDENIENKFDLSEKSTTITDEMISENLAEIMLSQGKTEKAIDIYKKLIWKFPQKKAYFASRIEELNNK